jgi:hypothetical protein
MFYFWGFGSAFFVYCALSWLFPAPETCVAETIYDDGQILEAAQSPEVGGPEYDSSEEKNNEKVKERER